MPHYDLLIKGGTIVDGTQIPRFVGDVAVNNGIIERIDYDIQGTADEVIDAGGRIVAPGVIDLHTHYDAQVHWDPYCTNSSWHGTTSIAFGNCGFGFAPCKAEHRDRYMQMMENTEQVPYTVLGKALPWTWETFPEWMAHLKSLPKGINVSTYLPLNPLMIYVMGVEAAKSRPATKAERQKMKDLLNEGMDAGALGLAFSYQGQKNGHTDYDGSPMPTDVMDPEEAFTLGEVLKERGQGIIQVLADMPGCELNRGIIEELAERSRRPILHNILQIVEQMPDYHAGILAWLDEMEAKGHTIYSHAMSMHTWTEFNFVDYNFWDSVNDVFKEFSLSGGKNEKLALAANADYQRRFREAYDPAAMMGSAGGSLDTFRLVNAHETAFYKDFEGKLLGEIAQAKGIDEIDLFFDLFIQSDAKAEVRTTLLGAESPELIADVLKHRRVLFGTSDGGAHVKYWSGGQFSTDVITWLSRDEGLFSLEEMHYKLSYLPARFAGLSGRGALLEGFAADVMVYDLANLSCNLDKYDVAFDLPDGGYRRINKAKGVDAVIVNGQKIYGPNTECTDALPGDVLCPEFPGARNPRPVAIAAE